MTPAEVSRADLPDWGIHDDGALVLRTTARTGSFARGLEFVTGIGALAERAGHHPDLELTYPRVVVTLTTHEAGGITQADIDLAREITSAARDLEIPLTSKE